MSWPMVKLGECCTVVGGATPKREVPEYWNSQDVPWVTPKDISKLISPVLEDAPEYISMLGLKNCSASILPKGSILLTSRAPIGNVAIAGRDMCTNQGFKSLVPGANVDGLYLYYCMLAYSEKLQDLGNGATFKEVSKKVVEEFEIPLPPLAEQKRIAAILDKADAIRRQRQQAIQLADDFLRAVFLQMFGDPVTNPKGWDCSKLDDLVSKPITYGILKPEEFVPHGIPMLRIQDLKNGRIDVFGEFHLVSERLSSQYKRTILEGNEILISLVGTIGIVAQVPKELQGANVHRNLGVIQLKDAAIVEFVTSFMQLPDFMTVLDRVTKGGVHKLLNLADLKEVEIPMPPIDLVKEFIEIKSFVASLKNMNESFSDELVFESLSQKAFSGQL